MFINDPDDDLASDVDSIQSKEAEPEKPSIVKQLTHLTNLAKGRTFAEKE